MVSGRVLVYGGKGALGSVILEHFKAKGFWTLNIDLIKNDNADANIILDPNATWTAQEESALKEAESALNGQKLDAILCVAGGWAGGSAGSKDFVKNADLMWKQSVWSSSISARLAALHLKPQGLLQLTGAKPALDGTPGMIGYGAAKAAVHQIVKSLTNPKEAHLPEGTTTLAILPVTLDTPMNRKWMPKADHSTWTPLEFVAELLFKWTQDTSARPESGSLVQLITGEGKTQLINS